MPRFAIPFSVLLVSHKFYDILSRKQTTSTDYPSALRIFIGKPVASDHLAHLMGSVYSEYLSRFALYLPDFP
jgi:hypothetical protein